MPARRRSKRPASSPHEENAEPANQSQRRRRLNSNQGDSSCLVITSDVERELAQYTYDLRPIENGAAAERDDWEENGWEPFEYSATFIPSDDELVQRSPERSPIDTDCPICYMTFDLAEHKRAKPSVCTHVICESCLKEWSQQTTSCPFCKRPYTSIVIFDGDADREEAVSPREHRQDSADEEASTDESLSDVDSEDVLADLLAVGDFVVPDGCVVCGLDRGDIASCCECQFAAHDNRCHNFQWDESGHARCAVCVSANNRPVIRRDLLGDGLLARLLRRMEPVPARRGRRGTRRPSAPPAAPRRSSRRRR